MPNGNVLTLVHDFRDVFHNSEFQSWRGDSHRRIRQSHGRGDL